MRYVITKLFAIDGNGSCCSSQAILQRESGQMRRINGQVGSRNENGNHITELRGTGSITIEVPAGTTLHIEPWEGERL